MNDEDVTKVKRLKDVAVPFTATHRHAIFLVREASA